MNVSGEYQGVNHWENATYSFNVTNGVASEWGWLSNGEYKFMYYPETGQIKNAEQATSFALEDGKGIPEYIVIPYTIEAFATDYSEYPAKTITLYATNSNYSIFRSNASANTKIVVPEGVTILPSSVFANNKSDNDNMIFILPATLSIISKKAFENGGLQSGATIPSGVTQIGSLAFSKCRFNEILFKSETAPEISSDSFRGILSTVIVRYPTGASGYDSEEFTGKFPTGTQFEGV